MNFLAHAVLSFGDPEILTGNISGDFVKGRKNLLLYPPRIRQGMELHRLIDQFTDQHGQTAKAKSFFRPEYHLYSGAFIDIVFDHFLANDLAQFKDKDTLLNFTKYVYESLENNQNRFPEKFKNVFFYMKEGNWLYDYRLRQGIHGTFKGLVRRALYLHDAEPAYQIFNQHYDELKACYQSFFPDVKEFVRTKWQELGIGEI